MVMKKRLKRYTALLLAASMVLSSSGMTTLGTEIGSSVESSDTESSGDSGSTQGSSSEEGGSSDSASEGGSSSHEQSGSGSEDGNNPDGEGSGSEDTDSDSDYDSESGKDETDDDPDGNTSDSKDPEESDDGNSNTSDSEDSEEGDNDSQTSDNKEEESGEGSHGGNGGGGSAGGGSGSGGNIGSGEIQGNPDADDPKAEDELIVDEEDKKDEDDKDNEDEINDYILEAIVFPEQERAAESIRKSAMRSARMLANTLNSDESSEDNEDEIGENGSDIADSSSSNYIERQVDVGDTVDDLKLPKEIILKVRPVEDEDDAEAETEGETDSGSDTASKSDAKKAGTDKDGSDTAETKGNEDNDSAEKDNKDEKDLEEIRIKLGEEDWLISYPDDFAGSDLSAFTSEGADILDEEGNPTGEKSEDTAEYPVWVFYPNLADIDIENMEGSYIDPSDFLSANNESTLDTYAAKALAVTARVGVQPQAEGEITIDIERNSNQGNNISINGQYTATTEVATYDISENTLTLLKDSVKDGVEYRITGSNSNINIVFAENVENATITLDDVNMSGGSKPQIDFTGVTNAVIKNSGVNDISPTSNYSAIKVPESTTLTISGAGILSVTGGSGTAAIGEEYEAKAGKIILAGPQILAKGGDDAAAIGAGEDGFVKSIEIKSGSVTAENNMGVAIGTNNADNEGTLKVYANAKLYVSAMNNNRRGGSGAVGGMTIDAEEDAWFIAYAGVNGEILVNSQTIENQTYFHGVFRSNELSTTSYQFEINNAANTVANREVTFPTGVVQFMVSIPGGTYTVEGKEEGSTARPSKYLGQKETETNLVSDYEVTSSSTTKYIEIQKESVPYFWQAGAKNITFDSADIYAEVDTNGYYVKWGGEGDPVLLQSSLPIIDVGFVEYANGFDKEPTGYWNINTYSEDPITNTDLYDRRYENGREDKGTVYSITIGKNRSEDTSPEGTPYTQGLEKGHTYYFRPYARNTAGLYECDYITIGTDADNDTYFESIEQPENDTERNIEFTIADVKWPTAATLPYGTDITKFESDSYVQLTAFVDGTTNPTTGSYTELVTESDEADKAGQFIDGTLATIEGELQFVKKNPDYTADGSQPEYIAINEGTYLEAGIYNGNPGTDVTTGLPYREQLYIQFVPSQDMQEEGYSVLTEKIAVTVNRMKVKVSDLTVKTKVYDANRNAPEGYEIVLAPADDHFKEIFTGLSADDDNLTASATNAEYNDKNANIEAQDSQLPEDDPRTIAVSGLSLKEDNSSNSDPDKKAVNYEFSEQSYVVSGASIYKRPIKLRPVQVNKWAGENFASSLSVEVITPTGADNLGLAVGEDVSNIRTWTYANDLINYPKTTDNVDGDLKTADRVSYKIYEVGFNSGLTSTNYKLDTTATTEFYLYQEKPVQEPDSDQDNTVNGNYTIKQDDGTAPAEVQNSDGTITKWYKTDVTIAPAVSRAPVSTGADGNTQVKFPLYSSVEGFNGTQQGTNAPTFGTSAASIRLDRVTDGISFYLKSDSGARTYSLGEDERFDIKIDKEAPTIGTITYSVKEQSGVINFINNALGGHFAKNEVTVYVPFTDKGTDENPSGISGEEKLYYSLKKGTAESDYRAVTPTSNEDGDGVTAEFTIPLGQNDEVDFYVKDNAGNIQKLSAVYKGGKLWIVENDEPEIASYTVNGVNILESALTTWFNKDTNSVYIKIVDPDSTNNDRNSFKSGLQSVDISVKLNDEEYTAANKSENDFTDENRGSYEYEYDFKVDGKVEISITAEDRAGNKLTDTRTFYVDSTDPVVDIIDSGTDYSNKTTEQITFTVSDGVNGSGVDAENISIVRDGNSNSYEAEIVPEDESTGTATYTFDADFNGTYVVSAEDNSGRVGKAEITIEFFDRVKPAITDLKISSPEKSPESGWYNTDVIIGITALDPEGTGDKVADAQSKIKTVEYYIPEPQGATPGEDDWEKAEWAEGNNSITIDKNGRYSSAKSIQVRLTDNAGNVSDIKNIPANLNPILSELKIDKTEPVLTVTADDAWEKWNEDYNSGTNTNWHNKEVSFKLGTTSEGTPISGVTYQVSIDNGLSWQEISAFSGESGYMATHSYAKISWDAESNTLKISGIFNESLTFKAQSGSGLDSENSESYNVKVQMVTVPVPEVKVTSEETEITDLTKWITAQDATVTVEKEASHESGAEYKTYYTVTKTGSKNPVVENELITANEVIKLLEAEGYGDGEYTFTAWNIDNAGTRSQEKEVSFKLDTTKPETGKVTYYKTDNSTIADIFNRLTLGFFFNEDLKVQIEVSDETSGVAELYYRWAATEDGLETASAQKATLVADDSQASGRINSGTAEFEINLPFSGYVEYWVEDNAGLSTSDSNKKLGAETGENGQALLWIIERDAPKITEPTITVIDDDTSDPNDGKGNNNWYTLPVKITATVTDNDGDNGAKASGIREVTYSYKPVTAAGEPNGDAKEETKNADNEASLDSTTTNKEYTVEQELIDDNIYSFEVSATDNAGTAATPKKIESIKIDTKAPNIDVESQEEHLEWSNKSYEISFKVDDNEKAGVEVSGVDDSELNTGDAAIKVSYSANQNSETVEAVNNVKKAADGSYTFEAAKNGYYTISVTDRAGWTTPYTRKVDNIDYLKPDANIVSVTPDPDNKTTGYYTEHSPKLTINPFDNMSEDGPSGSSVVSGVSKVEIYIRPATEDEKANNVTSANSDFFDEDADWGEAKYTKEDIKPGETVEYTINADPDNPEVNGIVWVKVVVTDKAGNVSDVNAGNNLTTGNTRLFKFDNGDPIVSLKMKPTSGTWINKGSYVITLDEDSADDVNDYYVKISDLDLSKGGNDITIKDFGDDGKYILLDRGLSEFEIDGLRFTWDGDNGVDQPKTLTVEAEDDNTNDQKRTYDFKIVKPASGRDTDLKGNNVYIDTKAPEEGSYEVSGTASDEGWYGKDKLIPEIKIADPEWDNAKESPESIFFKFWKGEITDQPEEEKELSKTRYPVIPLSGEVTEANVDGIWNLTFRTEDEAENSTTYSDDSREEIQQIKVDITAPYISNDIELLDAAGNTGNPVTDIYNTLFGNFYNEKFWVQFTANDNTSGIKSVKYYIGKNTAPDESLFTDTDLQKVGGGTDNTQTYQFPVLLGTIASEIVIRVVDNADNVYTTKLKQNGNDSTKWTVEDEKPELSVKISDPTEKDWYNAQSNKLTFEASAYDKESGIKSIDWYLTDEDDLVSNSNIYIANEDAEAPEGMSQADMVPDLIKPISVDKDGKGIDIKIVATDNAGNATRTDDPDFKNEIKSKLSNLNIDTNKPVIELTSGTLPGTKESGAWTNKTQTVKFTVTDSKVSGGGTQSGVNVDAVKVTKTVGQEGQAGYEETEFTVAAGSLTKVSESEAEGKVSFRFEADENAVYTISASDTAENPADNVYVTFDKIDKTAPGTPEAKANNSEISTAWYAKDKDMVLLSIISPPNEPGGAEEKTQYKLWNTKDSQTESSGDDSWNDPNWENVRTNQVIVTDLTDGIWKLRVRTIDAAGNVDEKTTEGNDSNLYTIYRDKTEPEVDTENLEVKSVNNNFVADFFNWLTFGNFFKEGIKITVPVTDDRLGSGAAKLYYAINVAENGNVEDGWWETIDSLKKDPSDPERWYAEITINVEDSLDGRIVVVAEDAAGNKSKQYDLTGEKDSNFWLIETTAPVISDIEAALKDPTVEEGKEVEGDESKNWYRGKIDISSLINDKKNDQKPVSGINEVSLAYTYKQRWYDGEDPDIRGSIKLYEDPQEREESFEFKNSVGGADASLSGEELKVSIEDALKKNGGATLPDGVYTFRIGAKDNSNNKTATNDEKKATVYVDTIAPVGEVIDGDSKTPVSPADGIQVHIHINDSVSRVNPDTVKVYGQSDSDPEAPDRTKELELDENVEIGTTGILTHELRFTVNKNGNYFVEAKDYAGNPMDMLKITIKHIDDTGAHKHVTLTSDPKQFVTSGQYRWVGAGGAETEIVMHPAEISGSGSEVDVTIKSFYKLYSPEDGTPPTITEEPAEGAKEFGRDIDLGYGGTDNVLNIEGKWTLHTWSYKLIDPDGEGPEAPAPAEHQYKEFGIYVDKTKPIINILNDESDLDSASKPKEWTSNPRTVYFTAVDQINNGNHTNTDPSGVQDDSSSLIIEVYKDNNVDGNPDDVITNIGRLDPTTGKYFFKVNGNWTYVIKAHDQAGYREKGAAATEIGNEADPVTYVEDKFDNQAPQNANVEIVGTESDYVSVDWYKEKAPVVEITQPEAEAEGTSDVVTYYDFYYSQGNQWIKDEGLSGDTGTDQIAESAVIKKTLRDGVWGIRVWTVDGAGNQCTDADGNATAYENVIGVDTKPAEITAVTTEIKGTSTLEKIINSLSFGIFCNEAIGVDITFTDANPTVTDKVTGAAILRYTIGSDTKEIEISNDHASFEIPIGTKAEDVKLIVIDGAGNESNPYYVIKDGVATASGLETKWTLEQTAPEVTFDDLTGANPNGYFNGTITVNYKVTDPDSYLDKVYIKKDNESGDGTAVFDREASDDKRRAKYEGSIELNGGDRYSNTSESWLDDGIYHISVKAIDNAGNEVTESSEKLKLDRTAPVIAADIESDVVNWDSIWHKANEVTLTVTATDNLSGFSTEESEKVSGIKVEKTYNGTEKDVEVTETIDSTSQGKTIKGSFKLDTNGTYKVTVTDMAGNTVTKKITVLWIDDKPPADIDESGKIGDETVVLFDPAAPSAVTGWYNKSTDDSDPAKDNTGTPKITINAVQEDSMRADGAQDLEETDTSKITTRYALYRSDSEGNSVSLVKSGSIPDVNAENSVMLDPTASGYYTLKINRVDAAGNKSEEDDYVKTFKIDAQLPDIVSVTEDSGPALTSKTVFVVAGDDFSGLYNDAADIEKSIEVKHYVENVDQNTEINVRVANEDDKADNKYPQNVSAGQTVYAFDVNLKGEYRIYVTDIAGNTKEASVEYQYIDSKQPDAPEIKVDGGEYDIETGWYKLDTEPDNFDNAPYFKLEPKFSEDTVTPYTLHYRMWNAKDPAHDSESAPLFTTGDDTTDSNVAINTDGKPGLSEAEIVEANNWVPAAGGSKGYLKIEVPTDGEWYLKAWTESASGLESAKPDPANFKLDRVRPETDTDEENGGIAFDLTNDNPIAEFINWLSFGNFFNREIKVTVYVKDETSFAREDEGIGYTVYDPEDEKVLSSGIADIKYTAGSDSKKGSGSFTIPVGTDGNIFISLTDNAGNVKDKISLVKDGSNRWIIENQAPQFVEIDPANGARDVVIADLDAIRIYYAEWVEPTGKADIEITVSGNTYTADMTSPEVTVAITDGTGVASSSTPSSVDEARKQAVVTVPISLFKDGQGNALNILPDNVYAVTLYDGALRDLARNENTVVNSFFITQPASELPAAIEDITVTPGEEGGLYMNPSEFDEDVKEYIIAGMDEAFDENGNMLEDIVIDPRFSDQAPDNDATDADITKAVLRDKDDPSVEIALTVNGDGTCTVPENLIEEGKDYEIEITADLNGREDTYTFSLYTGMLTAEIKPSDEEAPSTMPDITVSAEDLKASVDRSKLMPHFLKGEKIKLTMTISVPSAEVIGDEITAFTEYDKANGRTRSVYGYYPFDIKITKTSSAGNETELITEIDEPIDLRIEMPDSVKGRDIYGVFGHHNGQVIDMAYTVPDDESYIEIHDLSKFSIYAISYKGKSTGGGGTGGSSGGGGGSGGGPSGSVGSGGGTVTVSGTTAYYGGTWINDGYLFIESDGNRPSNEWLRIDGKLYRFGLDGFRTTAYLEYKFNPDGSLSGDLPADVPVRDAVGTWLKDGWWYKTVGGGYLAGGWYYLFYQGRFEWYYFNADGWMLDGWLTLTDTPGDGGPADTAEVNPDGTPVQRTYYLHTTHDWTRGRMYTDWHFIDGKWYYFRTKPEGNEGSLVRNGITLTGHRVGPDGAWDGVGPTPTEAQ